VALGIVAAAAAFALGVRSLLAALTFATTVFVAVTIGLDFTRATRARVRLGESILPAMGGLLLRHNRRYGGFIVHLASSSSRSRDGIARLVGADRDHPASRRDGRARRYRFRFDGLTAVEESNHFKGDRAFTVSNGKVLGVLRPAKKFYPPGAGAHRVRRLSPGPARGYLPRAGRLRPRRVAGDRQAPGQSPRELDLDRRPGAHPGGPAGDPAERHKSA